MAGTVWATVTIKREKYGVGITTQYRDRGRMVKHLRAGRLKDYPAADVNRALEQLLQDGEALIPEPEEPGEYNFLRLYFATIPPGCPFVTDKE